MKDSKATKKQTVNEALNETYRTEPEEKRKSFTDKARKKGEAQKNNLGGF